jgi:branched-chain amino acid transport system substrate-binding protein
MKWGPVIIGLSLAVVLSAWGTGLGESQSAPIEIGLNVDYTGAAPHEGHGVFNGAALAFEQQNAKGGINGHKIEWKLGDNQCDPSVGINAVQKLIADHVVVMIGSNCSSVTLAQMPIIQRAGVPMLAVTDVSPKITEQAGVGGNPWMFRLNPNSTSLATSLAVQVIAKQVKSLAILVVSTDFGHGVADLVSKNVPGVNVVMTADYQEGQGDFRALLTKMASLHPEGLLIADDYPGVAQIVNQIHELGIPVPKLYSNGDAVEPAIFPLLGNPHYADGLVEASQWFPGMPDTDYVAKAVKARYGEDMNVNLGLGYFGGTTLIRAMSLIKGDITPTSVADALRKVDFDLPGFGRVKFDAHNQAHPYMFVVGIVDGKIKIISRVIT